MISFSPAKINAFFRTLFKRDDGYHEIASLYFALDFGDILEVTYHEKDTFSSNVTSLTGGVSNLVIRARDLFRAKTGIDEPLSIHLTKNIPMEAGLGGGSSNAATMLYAMNALFGKPLQDIELMELGSTIGSDVPFFFSSGAAYCTGRGEKIKNVALMRQEEIWLLIPKGLASSTPKVYGACIPGEVSTKDPKELLESFLSLNFSKANDLEPAAYRTTVGLEEVAQSLAPCFSHVALTGSGSAFYATGRTAKALPENVDVILSRTLERQGDSWYDVPKLILS